MARPRKADQNGRDTGELIYDCAVDLMYERGFHGTSLRDVAKAVGVQMSTLYYYYNSKQALLLFIMTRTTNALSEMVRAAMKPGQTPIEQLERAITAHVEFHAQRPKEARIAETELRSLEPENLKEIVTIRDEYEEIFATAIKAGQICGDFGSADVRITVRAMLVALTDVANWFKPDGRLTLDEVSATYRNLFLDGLSARVAAPLAPSQSA
ncbi:TetR/AcrR family transcriptional regulator [Rhodococcus pyridinivorans]|uniref:TetR/AcrR family transcriptional regulator n=1 Tax=Rhodococcus pyridinivorans TaxID=103816 RepID=UPI001E60050E|nr:TetR/AcrR family transcriptional regulator [Rhodococcus pyridinivorans]MCD5422856.1 TetR/AcrR family transcriptional regulator [Rhodococcus pyridinivorans]